jgi:hypothetical protein
VKAFSLFLINLGKALTATAVRCNDFPQLTSPIRPLPALLALAKTDRFLRVRPVALAPDAILLWKSTPDASGRSISGGFGRVRASLLFGLSLFSMIAAPLARTAVMTEYRDVDVPLRRGRSSLPSSRSAPAAGIQILGSVRGNKVPPSHCGTEEQARDVYEPFPLGIESLAAAMAERPAP